MDPTSFFEESGATARIQKKFPLDWDNATSTVNLAIVRVQRYKGTIEKPENFYNKVLYNEAKRLVKWQNKHKAFRLNEYLLAAPPVPEKTDDWPATVSKLLNLRLDEKDSELLRLRFVEQKGYRAIAHALGISATAARSRFSRIKKMARARRLRVESAA